MNAKDIISKLELQPHPEGGFYKETYRSGQSITVDNGKIRNVSTAIFYLLENKDKSNFHRIESDELWFFHSGEPLEIVYILNDQQFTIVLGNNIDMGEVLQAMIPANTWFGSKIKTGIGYSLVSCTVAPGFDFADFEIADRATLITLYPHLNNIINEYTKPC